MKPKGLLLLLISVHAVPVFAQRPGDYGRFQVILDKQLLGRPAMEEPISPVTAPPSSPSPSWAMEYRMTMMTRDAGDGSIRVGLQNVRDNSGFLLIEGDASTHGYQLSDADFEAFRATIRYNGNAHVFQLESGAVATPAAVPVLAPGGRVVTRRSGTGPFISPGMSPNPPRRPEPDPVNPEENPEAVPTRFNSPEELQIHLQNVQMDAIRTGKPPLPIPLTPEMDEQLVREGVLPPLENE